MPEASLTTASPGLLLAGVWVAHMFAVLSPGPNVLIVSQTAMSSSRAVGLATALGIASGAALWSIAAITGLSLILAAVPWMLRAISWLGALYLSWLAFKLWRGARRSQSLMPQLTQNGIAQGFMRGLITNMTNPKALLFYGSVFATLVRPEVPPWVPVAAFVLFTLNSALWHVALVFLLATPRAQDLYARLKPQIDLGASIALALLAVALMVGAVR